MKPATIKELKQELQTLSSDDLVALCLRLSNFKKENKELLTYLLYEASDESAYVESIKRYVSEEFNSINRQSYYYIKKSARKILRSIKKYIRFSKNKETEVALLMHFCTELKEMHPPMNKNVALHNLYQRQINAIRKAINYLHEDLQYDYLTELDTLK